MLFSTIKFKFIVFLTAIVPVIGYGQQQNGEAYLEKILNKYEASRDSKKAYIKTDKYLYEAGEDMWVSAILVDRESHRPAKGEDMVYLSLDNMVRDNSVSIKLRASDGKMKGKIQLPDDLVEGKYYLRASLNGNNYYTFQKEILIKKKAFPDFIVDVKFANKYYGAGDVLTVDIHAKTYSNEPVGRASYDAVLMNGNTIVSQNSGKLNKSGHVLLEMDLGDLEPEALKFKVYVKDRRLSEAMEILIPTKSQAVDLYFYPEGKNLVHGVLNKMAFKATDRFGNRFPFEGKILTEDGEEVGRLKSDENGEGVYGLRPHANQALKVQITSPYKIEKTFEFPPVNTIGATLVLADSKGDSLSFHVLKNLLKSSNFNVAIIHRGEKIGFKKLDTRQSNQFRLAKSSLKAGINQITLFDSLMVPLSEQLYYIPAHNDLDVSVAAGKDSHNLREKVVVSVDSDEAIWMGLSIVDEARINGNEPASDIVSYLLLHSELKTNFSYDNPAATALSENAAINEKLRYYSSVNDWDDVFSANKLDIAHNSFVANPAPVPNKSTYPASIEENKLFYSNFNYESAYLLLNPYLQEKIKGRGKKTEDEPYKQMLENGSSLEDAIYSIKPYKVLDGKIIFPGAHNSLVAQGGALIVINGMKAGTDISVLNSISPFEVESIKVSSDAQDILFYTGLNSVGVIDIKTKRGEKSDKAEAVENEEFTAPVYADGTEKETAIGSDLRTTIQWIPFTKEASFPLSLPSYHSDLQSRFVGTVEGIDLQGNPFSATFDYKTPAWTAE